MCGSSEPPETHIYDECDEEQGSSSHLGIRGPGVQVLGIASILLREAGQIASFSVQGWKKRKEEIQALSQRPGTK